MKTFKIILTGLTLVLVIYSCKKDQNGNTSNSQIDSEKSGIGSNLLKSQAYADTLGRVYDTTSVKYLNPYCIHYDSLFQAGDSLFMMNYNQFCENMYSKGITMPGYSAPGSMMSGGMMAAMDSDEMEQMMGDTAEVSGYYRQMIQLRDTVQIYEQAIYHP